MPVGALDNLALTQSCHSHTRRTAPLCVASHFHGHINQNRALGGRPNAEPSTDTEPVLTARRSHQSRGASQIVFFLSQSPTEIEIEFGLRGLLVGDTT